MDKRGAILIIIVEGYSILMYGFGFIFAVLWIQLSYFLKDKFTMVPHTFSWVFAM